MKLKPDTVRGRIHTFLSNHANDISGDVLEIGSRIHTPEAWWINNRSFLKSGTWTGVDIQPGENVDIVIDANAQLPFGEEFNCVICSEVLEHVKDPQAVVADAFRCLRPGGVMLITTLFAFPVHSYPSDYWRFSEGALRLLMDRAGFYSIATSNAGAFDVTLDDHGAKVTKHSIPIHTFARGVKC